MKDITTKEHLLHFMQSGFMRLSKYDLKFVQNVLHITTYKKEITTNQVNLFLKLLSKYKKQLDKHQLTTEVVNSLPWTIHIKKSDPYYTNAFISIVEDSIYFRAPYNKNFIKSFKQIPNNLFQWNNVEKRYEAPFSANSLKILVTISSEFYPVINYCIVTVDLLNTLTPYKNANIWSPTLCKVNDNFVIGASNPSLDQAIKHITLSDDIVTLSELARYGIKIHDSIINHDESLLFASKYITTIDFLEIEKLIQWLLLIKSDLVVLSGAGMATYFKNVLKSKLSLSGFKVIDIVKKEKIENSKSERPVLIEFTNYSYGAKSSLRGNMFKIIKMTNATPVIVK